MNRVSGISDDVGNRRNPRQPDRILRGALGVRDLGALQSAVHRPLTGYYQDRISEAAALSESLILNHPFLNGNKRTAVAAADIHLRIHGFVLDVASREPADFAEGLFRQTEMRIARIEPWLRARVRGF